MSTAEENGRFTPYEIAHIDRMYEEVMGGLTGMKVPPKHDIRPLGLRYWIAAYNSGFGLFVSDCVGVFLFEKSG